MNNNILKFVVIVVAATSFLISCGGHKQKIDNKNVPNKDITKEFLTNYAGTFMDHRYSNKFTIYPDGTFLEARELEIYGSGGLYEPGSTACRYTQSGKIVDVLDISDKYKEPYMSDASHVLNLIIEKIELDGSYHTAGTDICKIFEKTQRQNVEKQSNYSYYVSLLSDDRLRFYNYRDYATLHSQDYSKYGIPSVGEDNASLSFHKFDDNADNNKDFFRSSGAYEEISKEFRQLFGNKVVPRLYGDSDDSKYTTYISSEGPGALHFLGEYETEEDAVRILRMYMEMLREFSDIFKAEFVPVLSLRESHDNKERGWYSAVFLAMDGGVYGYGNAFIGGRYNTIQDGIHAVRMYADMLRRSGELPLKEARFIPLLYARGSVWEAGGYYTGDDDADEEIYGNTLGTSVGLYDTMEKGISAIQEFMEILKELSTASELLGEELIPVLTQYDSKWEVSIRRRRVNENKKTIPFAIEYANEVFRGKYEKIEEGFSAIKEYLEKRLKEKQ